MPTRLLTRLLAATALCVDATSAQADPAPHAQERWRLHGPTAHTPGLPQADAPRNTNPTTLTVPPLPIGQNGNPQPQSPPARLAEETQAPAIGQFSYYANTPVQPAGAQRSATSIVAPSVAMVRDTVLHVGNWYAALSRDSGQSWTHINPHTFFPALDGGFQGKQRALHVDSRQLTVWLLQHWYDATSHAGSIRIAVANGRAELASGNASDWTLYDFDPTDFGFPSNTLLDSADVGFNDNWLYVSANVHDGPTGAMMGAVVWRARLDDLQANGAATVGYLSFSGTTEHSHRFATGAGDGSRMFWATLLSTTSIRIYRQESTTPTFSSSDRTTAAWNAATTSPCAGPDGRGWLTGAIGRIRGACGTATELVFTWTSGGNGGNRPLPYTRVARFQVSDRTLIAEHDIYTTTDCWAYAAVASNTLGHVGGVIAIGGSARHVRTSAFLIDQYELGWTGVTAYRMGEPTNNPPFQRFGDFFDVQRAPGDGRQFIGTGNLMNGGDLVANVEPHFAWFGRDDYTPAWRTVQVASAPTGVAIRLDVTDINGQRDGTANFTRTFAPLQSYAVTAPATYRSGGIDYDFQRWVRNGNPQPVDQRTLSVTTIDAGGDVVEARYRARVAVYFDASAHLTGGAPITLTPSDLNNQGNGTTQFSRTYHEGTAVTMSAPANIAQHPFRRWRINGVDYPTGQQQVVFTIGTAPVAAAALYDNRTVGTYTTFGAGCAGSNGADQIAGAGTPETGQTAEVRLQGGAALSTTVLAIGASNTTWAGVPLPLALPTAPGCSVYASLDVTLVTGTDGNGRALVSLPIPSATNLVNSRVFAQYVTFDLPANPMGLTTSNGLEIRIGGIR